MTTAVRTLSGGAAHTVVYCFVYRYAADGYAEPYSLIHSW